MCSISLILGCVKNAPVDLFELEQQSGLSINKFDVKAWTKQSKHSNLPGLIEKEHINSVLIDQSSSLSYHRVWYHAVPYPDDHAGKL